MFLGGVLMLTRKIQEAHGNHQLQFYTEILQKSRFSGCEKKTQRSNQTIFPSFYDWVKLPSGLITFGLFEGKPIQLKPCMKGNIKNT